jgi:hypothetical protein
MKRLLVLAVLAMPCLLTAQTLSTIPKGLKLVTPCHYAYGCAVSKNGSVLFTEFNHQQLRQYNANGTIQVRRTGLPGMFGIALDTANNIFVGRDLGDVGSPGKITKITPAGVETDIVSGITRPRQVTTDIAGNVYFTIESPYNIYKWTKVTATLSTLVSGLSYPPEGVAVANDGTIYFSEYGAPESGVAGTVKKRTTGGTVTTLATGFWRARGLVIDSANSYLYLCTEANQEDNGNSGLLAKIKIADGTWTKALEGIDYPQFPSLAPDGSIYFTLTRDSWLAAYNPATSSTDSSWASNANVKIGVSGGQWTGAGTGNQLKINIGNSATLQGTITAASANGTVHGWVRVPESLISLDSAEIYTGCLTPEHPVPGIFRLPKVTYQVDSGSCVITMMALRRHTGKRWPMQNIGTCSESPDASFAENPTAYLLYFAWNKTSRVDTVLSPSYNEPSSVFTIVKGSEPGWIYSGTPFASNGQTWFNQGKYNTVPSASAWAEQDLGSFSGKSKYVYVMWHKNGPYRPDSAHFRVYDYTEDKYNIIVDQTKHADRTSHADDTFSGWYLLGDKKINITPSTKLRIYQDGVVGANEYLQSDAILLSDYPVVDNTSLGAATNFEAMPNLSVSSTGATGIGNHWGMQGLGFQYSTTNGKSFAATLDTNVIKDLPYGDYYAEVSWDYTNTDNTNAINVRYAVNGMSTGDIINQNKAAQNQSGSFVQGNSSGTWSGFYRLGGVYSHSAVSPIVLSAGYDASLYASKRFIFDMVRFVPADGSSEVMSIHEPKPFEKIKQEELSKFVKLTNYPNPFSASTNIFYSIPTAGRVVLTIVNEAGQAINKLVNATQQPGKYNVSLDGTKMRTGKYYAVLYAGGVIRTQKLVVLR